jgi:hypothetical protein
MARRVILETAYTFVPSTRTIVIPRVLQKERLLLITNVTTNKVLYNFSDPTLTSTNYIVTQGTDPSTFPSTAIILNYNTTSMSSTDKLQIVVDEIAEAFEPVESLIDPVGKFRVSNPQAMIDTDFEYGLQPTKWENLITLNNRASYFLNTQQPLTLFDIQATNGSATITANTYPTAPPAVGTPVLINDSYFAGTNGGFVVEANNTSSNANTFSFTARYNYTGTTGSIYNSGLTQAYTGAFYSNTNIGFTSVTSSGQVITATTTDPHGFQVGDGVYFVNMTAVASAPNGSWQVAAVPSSTTFQVIAPNAPTTLNATAGTIYPRPDGYFAHRAFDGGVQFTSGSSAPNSAAIRQTRKYFRYQAGKGFQMSSGTILKPNFNVDEIAANGTTITVTTKTVHNLNPLAVVTVSGASDNNYNGTFVVQSVINAFQFQYTAASAPTTTPATGFVNCSVTSWYGAANRLGMFDQQNGLFFEFDGQQLYAVRRQSTTQLSGFVNVTNNSSIVTGAFVNNVTTKFSKQILPGDTVVIRGKSYKVSDVLSDTSMTIIPAYRGPTYSGTNGVVVSKTTELRTPQSAFNIDKLDGTGPSGQILDLSKMQMFFIDYSWYGAGSIRYGFRDTQGRVNYVHKMVNNNQNTEAYMRSGNLPARYEIENKPLRTVLVATCLNSDTTLTVANTVGFPTSGTLLIADQGAFEYVNYTGISSNTVFTGLTRGKSTTTISSIATTANSANVTTTSSVTGIQNGMAIYGPGIPTNTYVYNIISGATSVIQLTQAATTTATGVTLNFNQMGSTATTHSYNATGPIAVYSHTPHYGPALSHWGTSVIMDGRFDADKNLQFTYGETSPALVPPGGTAALLSIRISPSVDNGIPGYYGQKEILNRMQLSLGSLDVLVQGSFLINLVLNGTVSANSGSLNTFVRTAVGTSSLAQIADHTGLTTISGGENIYGFYAVNSAGSNNYSVVSGDLTPLREIGNSILGGGLNNIPGQGVYPDGPDVVTILATNFGLAAANVQTRLSWTEAQA